MCTQGQKFWENLDIQRMVNGQASERIADFAEKVSDLELKIYETTDDR